MTAPRLPRGSTERTDEQGTYIAYHTRCTYLACGEELTSRNRSGTSLRCKPCASAKARLVYANNPNSQGQPSRAVTAERKAKQKDPQRIEAHLRLDAFLNNRENANNKAHLLSYLVDLELISRFRTL